MDTREVTSEYRLSQWAQVIQDRARSGETIQSYCESRGISRDAYFYWQRKLRETACNELSKLQQGGARSLAPLGFTEVTLVGAPTMAPPAVAVQEQICIECAGVRITAGSGYPADKLAAVLREAVRPC